MDGAGGVGGLLAVSTINPIPSTHFAAYDGNGNITALVDDTATTTALYEFNPFGGLIRCEGAFARANPFRFSTKFTDAETGLLYYGYRYYSPTLGRWIGRDPLQEGGGRNLYGFVLNDPLRNLDPDGQKSVAWWGSLLTTIGHLVFGDPTDGSYQRDGPEDGMEIEEKINEEIRGGTRPVSRPPGGGGPRPPSPRSIRPTTTTIVRNTHRGGGCGEALWAR